LNISSNRISIQRDQNNKKLETTVFEKLAQIMAPTIPEAPKKNEISFVGVEHALKELLELEKISQGN
jgi:predicted lipase